MTTLEQLRERVAGLQQRTAVFIRSHRQENLQGDSVFLLLRDFCDVLDGVLSLASTPAAPGGGGEAGAITTISYVRKCGHKDDDHGQNIDRACRRSGCDCLRFRADFRAGAGAAPTVSILRDAMNALNQQGKLIADLEAALQSRPSAHHQEVDDNG
jgi:hypothetical protein